MLKDCKSLGYKGIVFTVDAPRLGTRERDERNSFKMPDNLKFDVWTVLIDQLNMLTGTNVNLHCENK